MRPFQWWGAEIQFLSLQLGYHLSCVFTEFNITWAQSSGCLKAVFQQVCPTGAVVLDYVRFHTAGPQYQTCLWPLVPAFCSGKVCENSGNHAVMCLAKQFVHFCVILRQFAHHSPATWGTMLEWGWNKESFCRDNHDLPWLVPAVAEASSQLGTRVCLAMLAGSGKSLLWCLFSFRKVILNLSLLGM